MSGVGVAKVTISFDAWKAGHVAPSQHDVPVVAPKPGPKLEAVSARLKGELIHPNRAAFLVGVRFSPDGKRIIAGDYPGGVVVVWDVATGKQLTTIETGSGYRSSYNYFFLTPDWQTLFVSREKRKHERVDQGGKRLIRWTFDGDVRAWDLATGSLQRTYKHEPPRNIRLMQLSPDGTKLVTLDELPGTYEAGPKQATSLWDVRTGNYRTLPGNLQGYERFSADGGILAAVDEDDSYAQALKLFDTATGREKLSIPVRHKNTRVSVHDFSPDGRLMVGDYQVYERAKNEDNWQSWLKWWDTATGQEIASFGAEKNDSFFRSRFSPDGQTFAALNWRGEKIKLLLFDVSERRLNRTVILGKKAQGERVIPSQPAFSSDGKWLAITTHALPAPPPRSEQDAHDLPQPRIHLIDVAAGAVRETLVAPQGFTHDACCFSPDGRTLATAGEGRVLLWDMTKLSAPTARAIGP